MASHSITAETPIKVHHNTCLVPCVPEGQAFLCALVCPLSVSKQCVVRGYRIMLACLAHFSLQCLSTEPHTTQLSTNDKNTIILALSLYSGTQLVPYLCNKSLASNCAKIHNDICRRGC